MNIDIIGTPSRDGSPVDYNFLTEELIGYLSGWSRRIVKYDFEGGNVPVYIGFNKSYDAADGDTDWIVTKFTWDGYNPSTKSVRVTSWTDRGSGW